ncbi:unnamed protein product [Xylocopa violacea]|uniref:Uncharacterized protein n=1 Tax=Xylocopa violacea TaxID=135666 RepID=A0ABP1NZ91_XYLVO
MTVRSHWFVAVLVTLTLFAIIVASDTNEIKPSKDDQKLKAFDVRVEGRKLKVKRSESVDERDTSNDLQVEVKPSPKRFVLFRTRPEPKISNEIEDRATGRKGDEAIDQGIQRQYEGRVERNVTPLNESRSAEKARLEEVRVMHEDWKRRECSSNLNDDKYAGKTNATGLYDKVRTRRSKRDAITTNIKNDDYYARKKAVMDKYYARQEEIEARYASMRITNAPNYVQATASASTASRRAKPNQQIGRMMTTNLRRGHRSSNGQTEKSPEENGDEYGSGDYDDSYEDASNQTTDDAIDDKSNEPSYNTVDDKSKQIPNSAIDNGPGPTSDDRSANTLATSSNNAHDDVSQGSVTFQMQSRPDETEFKWGNCTGRQVYQHNLNFSVHKSSMAYVDLSTMLEGSICVTCIRVIPLGKTNIRFYSEVRRGQDGGVNMLKLKFADSENLKLSYIVKIWAVVKRGDRCEDV